jgi:hypothetical protein
MDTLQRLITATALATLAPFAFAGYAQLAPPAGWSTSAGAATYVRAANESWTAAGTVRTNASLNVGGRAVTMPASMRFAANAGRVAAQAIRVNPVWWVAGAAVAAWLDHSGIRWDEGEGQWQIDQDPISVSGFGVANQARYPGPVLKSFAGVSRESVCQQAAEWRTSTYMDVNRQVSRVVTVQSVTATQCQFRQVYTYHTDPPVTSYPTASITTQVVQQPQPPRPALAPDFDKHADDYPMPADVPNALPRTQPIPVGVPVLNPNDAPSPLPQPLRVPTGAPVPVPGTDPQQYRQPVSDIVPANSPSYPWQVDIQPGTITGPDPVGITEPIPVPAPGSGGEPSPADPEDQPGLCDEYPNILACQELGEVEDSPLGQEELSFVIGMDGGWLGQGFVGCPADRTVALHVVPSVTFSWSLLCQAGDMARPFVIAMGWLSAIAIAIGVSRRAD